MVASVFPLSNLDMQIKYGRLPQISYTTYIKELNGAGVTLVKEELLLYHS